LFLFKNHSQFSLSCNTKRNTSCEALRSSPVSGKIITTTASSAPERDFGISGLPIQVFALFPLHSLSGSPVPQVSPDSVHAILMPDTMQAIIRFVSCTLLSRSRQPLDFDTLKVIYDTSSMVHFHSSPLSTP
jgi:hypothetical protein